jgi:amino acid adenylation domain-containing protein/non-ribosomal peptide synthase protein (TIGR01720 family)
MDVLYDEAKSEETKQELDYWLTWIEKDLLPLPVDYSYGENTEKSVRKVTCQLSKEETRVLLQDVPQAYRTQMNEVLLTALAQAINQWTKQSAICVHIEGHGREELHPSIDLSRTVGWLTSLYPVCVDLTDQVTIYQRLKTVKEQVRQIPRRGIGYGLLRYLHSDPTIKAKLAPMSPEISFNYLGQLDGTISRGALFQGEAPEDRGKHMDGNSIRPHLLDVVGAIMNEKLQMTFWYSEAMHRQETIEQLASDFITAIRDIIAHRSSPEAGGYIPSDFPLAELSQQELEQYLGESRQIEDVYPLSPLQQGLLFHTLYGEESGDYVVQMLLTFQGKLDPVAFEKAWQTVMNHYEILRAYVIWKGLKTPHQVIAGEVPVPIQLVDLSRYTPEEQEQKIQAFLEADRKQGFSLDQAPLMRLTLFQKGIESYQLAWSYHHVILDGWSMPLVIEDLLRSYDGWISDSSFQLQEVRPYKNYIQWLKQQDLAEAEAFWRKKLQGYTTPLSLPIEKVQAESVPPDPKQKVFSLSKELTNELQAFARQNHLTLNTLIQGAWALLLSRYSGERDLVYGATGSGRPAELTGIEKMVGLFINSLPVRVYLPTEESILNWLQNLQQEHLEMRQFEYTPLLDIQGWSELSRGVNLFDYMYVFENYPVGDFMEETQGELQLTQIDGSEQVNYPLALVVAPGKQVWMKWLYDQNRFTNETIEQMSRHLEILLRRMIDMPKQPLATLSILTEEEERQLAEWNQTQSPYSLDCLVHEWVARHAEKQPNSSAIVSIDEIWSYGELNGQANQLAHYLQKCGVGPDTLVGVYLERSPEMILSQLAILKAGGAYVPLDPALPSERVAWMLQDASISIVLTTQKWGANLSQAKTKVLCLDTDKGNWLDEARIEPTSNVTADHLAYVIYTSGSTGTPKGVEVCHRSLINLLHWYQKTFSLTSGDRIAQMMGVAFDPSVWEVWSALWVGASLYLPTEEDRLSPVALKDWILKHKITIICVAPSMLESLFLLSWPEDISLRFLFTGGDQLYAYPPPNFPVKVFNLYGPTESTVLVAAACINGRNPWSTLPPIGRAIDNIELHVLDDQLLPVPIGIPGELYIGGEGLARGYVGQDELTRERFIFHPFSDEPKDRLYKTGDLVRYLPDGQLEFLGRIDHQVKIRGFRIELGEIETVLNEHPTIKETLVQVFEETPGKKQLVAYVVASENRKDEWREWLEQRLPKYMIPALFVVLNEFPRTTNGKVDRKKLPKPDYSLFQVEYVPPRTPMEKKITKIWEEVLQVERVGLHDNFFELGGHSLLATQVISRINETLRAELPIRYVFERPTVAELVKQIKSTLRSQFVVKR